MRSKKDARVAMKVLEQSARFRSGMEFHLRWILKQLEEDERRIKERLKSKKQKRNGKTLDPSTPPMRSLLTMDPLAHLANPLTPMDLSDAETLDSVTFEPDASKTSFKISEKSAGEDVD